MYTQEYLNSEDMMKTYLEIAKAQTERLLRMKKELATFNGMITFQSEKELEIFASMQNGKTKGRIAIDRGEGHYTEITMFELSDSEGSDYIDYHISFDKDDYNIATKKIEHTDLAKIHFQYYHNDSSIRHLETFDTESLQPTPNKQKIAHS